MATEMQCLTNISQRYLNLQSSSLYGKVTPAADIKFEASYSDPYYQQYMKPKVVPNLILLILSLLLFLFFIFW